MNETKTTEFNTLSMGNTARIIQHYYLKNEETPTEILNTIDFSEDVRKSFYFKYSTTKERVEVSESTVLNIVKNLPFEAYAKILKPEWIEYKGVKNDYSIIDHLMFFKEYDIVEHILNLCYEKELSSKERNSSFSRAFHNDVVGKILNISSRIYLSEDNTKTTISNYMKLFEKTLPVFEYMFNDLKSKFIIKEKEPLAVFNMNNWHKKFDTISNFFRDYDSKNLNLHLASAPEAFSLLLSGYNQYSKNEKNPFHNEDVLYNAIYSNNTNLVNLLYKDQALPNIRFYKALEENIANETERFTNLFDKNQSTKKFNPATIIKKFKTISKNIEYKPIDYKILSICLSLNSKELTELILNEFPQIKEEKLLLNLTAKQWSVLFQLTNEIKTTFNFELKDIDTNFMSTKDKELLTKFPSFNYYFASNIDTLFPTKFEELSNKERQEIYKVLEEKMLNVFTINSKTNLKEKLSSFFLTNELSLSTKKQNKVTTAIIKPKI